MGRPKIIDTPERKNYRAWRIQKNNAARRGIEWQFTYDEWVTWWGDDITKRGKEKHCLVMSRNNDTGPYHPDNVSKMTASKNVSDGNVGKIFTEETRARLSHSMTKGIISDEVLKQRSIAVKAWCVNNKKETKCLQSQQRMT